MINVAGRRIEQRSLGHEPNELTIIPTCNKLKKKWRQHHVPVALPVTTSARLLTIQ